MRLRETDKPKGKADEDGDDDDVGDDADEDGDDDDFCNRILSTVYAPICCVSCMIRSQL